MMVLPLDAGIAVFCLSLSAILYSRHRLNKSLKYIPRSQAYIFENQVTHARLLPAESAHAFTYPTLSLFLSLDALESHSLDIARGWVFGYGGIWGHLVGLRSRPYLAGVEDTRTIRGKLEALLEKRGFCGKGNRMEDAWIMTMPSLLGYEGINPLTVYFCYRLGSFWLAVLEIHNTFGESHVHVLEVGTGEDIMCSKGYDHQWTFLREFHVSPFNDRSGFYTVSIKAPSHPPTAENLTANSDITLPRPAVRVHLHTLAPGSPYELPKPGALKLTALLRPTSARPLTTSSLFLVLCRTPFTLFLSFPRILLEAWKLHYRKRLDVFPRPEPLPQAPRRGLENPRHPRTGGGVKWLSEGLFEKYARQRVEAFLQRRVEETNTIITLTSQNPTVSDLVFQPRCPDDWSSCSHLSIYYLSPRFFTILLLCPSPAHAFLLGSDTEKIFLASSQDLFVSMFSPDPIVQDMTALQHLRAAAVPRSIPLPVPPTHVLDDGSWTALVLSAAVIRVLLLLDWIEAWIFRATHARVVAGDEPWKQWERAGEFLKTGKVPVAVQDVIGSVRREG